MKASDLTERQRQIIRLISLGCSGEEMAKILGLAESTIDNHKSAILEALGFIKPAMLTRWAIQNRVSSLKDTLTPAEKRVLKKTRR